VGAAALSEAMEVKAMKEREGTFRASHGMMGLIMVLVVVSISRTISHILDVHPTVSPGLDTNSSIFQVAYHQVFDGPHNEEDKDTQTYDPDALDGAPHREFAQQGTELPHAQDALTTQQRTHAQKAEERLRRQYEENSSHSTLASDATKSGRHKHSISSPHGEEQGIETLETPQDLASSTHKSWGFKPTSKVVFKQLTPGTPQCHDYEKGRANSPRKTWVFENNKHNMDYSHMAMLSRLPPNSTHAWIMVWQAAKIVEGAQDQQLWVAYSDDARRWTAAQPLEIPTKGILWSPVLHFDEGSRDVRCGDGAHDVVGDAGHAVSLKKRRSRTFLFFTESTVCLRPADKRAMNIPRYAPGGNIMMVYTYDGVSWTEPRRIYLQAADGKIPKVIANQMIVHPQTGYWVLPFWHERPKQEVCKTSLDQNAIAGVLISKDRGLSWAPHGQMRVSNTWLIEGSVAVLGNGHVMQLFRTTTGSLYTSISKDSGLTWERPRKTALPNPDSKINVVRLFTKGNDLALAFNDMTQFLKPGTRLTRFDRGRGRLKVAISNTDGRNWTRIAVLEPGDNKHYFHYPTIVQDGCRLLVAYSVMQARPAVQQLHGVGGIRIAELGLNRYTDCTCKHVEESSCRHVES